ncbi:MAG TPA: M14 family metallopeptidase [Vicinamibacterales bacterium]|nr:M14 family metallopeptidase [Vicinamibacterales bacterium]
MAHHRVASVSLGLVLSLAAPSSAPSSTQRGAGDLSPDQLARLWDAEHVSPPIPALLGHADVVRRLDDLSKSAAGLFQVVRAGESVEGRSIHHVRAGTGPSGVLLWSQMHGDEPTATSALFDLFEYLRRHRDEPVARRILGALTLHVVPMLNPDGAERFERRNAQGVDINRDALRLQTPEGRILKELRDRHEPRIGFNLHNQGWRTSIGDPPRPASISLLSVAYDEARTENAGRRLTKRLCVVIRDALEPLAPGQIGRYDDAFEVRAFGDNITRWGTPVVLIETGAWASADPDPALVRLNFVALVTALDALASGRVDRADVRAYEELPLNESRLFAVLIRNAILIPGSGIPPFTADVGITAARRVRGEGARRDLQTVLNVDDLGDLRTSSGLQSIDATGMTVIPATSDSIEPGQVIDLPEWRTRVATPVAVGQPARLALVKPAAEPGKFAVEMVIR